MQYRRHISWGLILTGVLLIGCNHSCTSHFDLGHTDDRLVFAVLTYSLGMYLIGVASIIFGNIFILSIRFREFISRHKLVSAAANVTSGLNLGLIIVLLQCWISQIKFCIHLAAVRKGLAGILTMKGIYGDQPIFKYFDSISDNLASQQGVAIYVQTIGSLSIPFCLMSIAFMLLVIHLKEEKPSSFLIE